MKNRFKKIGVPNPVVKTLKSTFMLLSIFMVLASTGAYTTQMYVPAVLSNQNEGTLTLMLLNVTSGTGHVTIRGPPKVEQDTLLSAQTAVRYAASSLGLNSSNYNFAYTIEDFNTSVSGPSGGLAFTLLAIAGLQQRQLSSGFTATGTVSPNGAIGLIGGAYEKAGAAKDKGLGFVAVPATDNDTLEALIYYIAQQTYNLPLVEVANISEVLPYAFGTKAPVPLTINLSQSYNVASLSPENLTCTNCNASTFSLLVNYTIGFSTAYVSNISSNFSYVKQSLLDNLEAYKALFKKGYLYTSADFSFLDFIQAFTLANSKNLSVTRATSLLNNVSAYCSSLIPPPMTDANYEYVVGGKLRQSWGNITISNARALLSTEETTDDIIQSIHSAASSLAWCKAAYQSYTIASSMGGNYVQNSVSLRNGAFNMINSIVGGSGLYWETAMRAYDSGDYTTALYSAVYANVFGPSSGSNLTMDQVNSKTLQNMYNASEGTWPSQFALQSEFYFRQSMLSQGALKRMYSNEAYSVSQLAVALVSANKAVSDSFIPASPTQGLTQQVIDEIDSIQQSISQIYSVLLMDAVLMFAILVILLFHLLSPRSQKREKARPARRGNRRKR
jgi:predicted S18 family serine protease